MKKKTVQKKTSGVPSRKSKKLSSMSFEDLVDTIGDDSSEHDSDSEIERKKKVVSKQTPVNGSHGKKKVVSKRTPVNGSHNHVQDNSIEENNADSSNDENDSSSGDEAEASESEDEAADLDQSVDNESDDEAENSEQENDENIDAGKKHKRDLGKLKDIDPEFYKYLEENDKKLLQFDASDSDESEEGASPGKVPKSVSKSDSEEESDEDSGHKSHSSVVTMKMVKQWRENLSNDKSVKTISEVIQVFHAALQRVLPENEKGSCPYKVVGGAVFNAVVQMCVIDLLPALQDCLKLPSKSWSHTQLPKSKHWVKVRSLVKSYLADLLQLLEGVASVNVTTILLKHLHQMCSFAPCFPNLSKKLLKKTITLWSSGEETVRVLAFMCALKVTTCQQQTYLDSTLRYMYMAYINNTKFVSPSTLPGINFMRRSLAEMFLLDENVSYHHAFLYIRQLAIHLRNAINLQKKDSIQAVYNWQFLASLALWVEMLSSSNKPALRPLVYPVVQVITGALKLVPTAQYYPLRFHYVRLLTNLSRDSGVFVPTLPFLLEVLNSYDFNKKHSKVSMKPLDLTCILRVSKVQQQENGFKDAVIESIYNLLLQYSAAVSHSIAFPDLMVPTIVQLKTFLKKCKIPNYTKKMKQMLDKIESNCKFIEKERKSLDINLADATAVENWEISMKVKGTPLSSFYSSWEKMNSMKESNQQVDKVNISGKTSKKKEGKKGVEGPVDHLPSDDSEESESENDEEISPKRPKTQKQKQTGTVKKAKIINKPDHTSSLDTDDEEDVVEDASLADWNKL